MEEQESFLELLGEIKNIAALQQNRLTISQIKQYLNKMELDDDKMDAVFNYLSNSGIEIEGYIPAHDKASFNRKLYRQEVNNLVLPCNETLNKIVKDFLMGDKISRDKLAESKLNHVIKIASKYKKHIAVTNEVVSIDDIIAEGNVGLLIGISVVEKNKEQYFKLDGEPDYEAVYGIINMEIINAIESMIDMASEDKDWENAIVAKVNLLHEAVQYLAEELERIPSKEEISEYTRMSIDEINNIYYYLSPKENRTSNYKKLLERY